jgi:hypothetical protein
MRPLYEGQRDRSDTFCGRTVEKVYPAGRVDQTLTGDTTTEWVFPSHTRVIS